MQIASANSETLATSESAGRVPITRILAVIVLHKLALHDSQSYLSLLTAAEHIDPSQAQFHLLVIDNLPAAPPPQVLPPWIQYERAASNLGLAAAYNRAVELALVERHDWILTLDQDTELPPNFLARFAEIAQSIRFSPMIAAIVPQLIGDRKMLSPLQFRLGAFPRWYPAGFTGTPDARIFAFNSGAMLRVNALRQVGGYDPRFWLDYSDTRMFCELAKYGKQVTIAGDLQLNHSFSMLDKQQRMSAERYRELLATETALWDMEMSDLAGIERTIRLIGRFVKHIRHRDRPEFRRETSRALMIRLFRSRKWRACDWQQHLTRRFPGVTLEPQSHSNSARPKVSVCMATFNGEKYLRKQLESILIQLDEADELIIVDDASSDTTTRLISDLMDPRIVLIRHPHNQGVVASFEHAVRSATGDILFLSDQDDLWAPNRVSRTLEAFSNNRDLDLVVTDVALISEYGRMIVADRQLKQWRFTSKLIPNLVANRFQGSAMAFRSSLLREILPFPKKRTFLHDAWIGARCALARREVGYIGEPLLFYRRHGRNLSGRLPAARMLWKRIELITALFTYSLLRPFK